MPRTDASRGTAAPRTFRLLTHAVEVEAGRLGDDPAMRFLGGVTGRQSVPLLVRTRYELRGAGGRDGTIELTEDGGRLGSASGLDAALEVLDLRLRRRVLDLAAHSGWLPLHAGLAGVGDRRLLVVGGPSVGAVLAHAVGRGVEVTAGDVVLVRGGSALGYPIPLRMPAGDAADLPVATGLGRWRTSTGELDLRPTSEPIGPARVDGVVLLDGREETDDRPGTAEVVRPGAAEPPGAADVLRAVLAARIETGVRSRGADVAEASALLGGLRGVHRIPPGRPAWRASLLAQL